MTGSIDPSRAQVDAFKALARDRPIRMLTLIRLASVTPGDGFGEEFPLEQRRGLSLVGRRRLG